MKADKCNHGLILLEPTHLPLSFLDRIILTIEQLLAGKQLEYPKLLKLDTQKKAQKMDKQEENNASLFIED